MKASEFIQRFSNRSPLTWESAVVDLFRNEQTLPIKWLPIRLSDGSNEAIVFVSSDYLTIGEGDDTLRIPLTPTKAQDVANLYGAFLPTPWIVFRIWQESQKVGRRPMVPNKYANLLQYAEHDEAVKQQVRDLGGRNEEVPFSGHKKDVVISNVYRPGKVVIFGWYKPEPDVFTNKLPMGDMERQPLQPLSNVHGENYVDYSHGIRLVHPKANINGQEVATEELYTNPSLARLVSHEGPLRNLRYPSKSPVSPHLLDQKHPYEATTTPSHAERGLVLLDLLHRDKLR